MERMRISHGATEARRKAEIIFLSLCSLCPLLLNPFLFEFCGQRLSGPFARELCCVKRSWRQAAQRFPTFVSGVMVRISAGLLPRNISVNKEEHASAVTHPRVRNRASTMRPVSMRAESSRMSPQDRDFQPKLWPSRCQAYPRCADSGNGRGRLRCTCVEYRASETKVQRSGRRDSSPRAE